MNQSTTSLYIRESGNRQHPAVVFLHGGPLSGKMWQPQMDRLTNFYCLAPDLPGHGESPAFGPFNLKDAARQVADAIHEKVPNGKVHLVGLSLGGAVVLTLLRDHPEVAASALVSGTAARLNQFTGQFSLMTAGVLKFISPEKQAESAMHQLGVPEKYQPLVFDDLVRGGNEAYSRSMIVALMSMDLPETINCRFLVAVGERETIPARQAARKLLQLYSGARGVIVPKMHHLWNLQEPDLFSDTVRAWVNGQPLPDRLRLTGNQPTP